MMRRFKFDRFAKVIFLFIMMNVCSVVYCLFDENSAPTDAANIVSVIVMAVGTVLAVRAMNRCMKDVLSCVCVTIGVYMIVKFIPFLLSDGDISALFSIMFLMVGFAVMGFGINLYAGIEFNIVRIRFISVATIAIVGAQLYFHYVFSVSRWEWFLEVWNMFPLLLMAVALFLVANDKSLGFVGAITNIRQSVRAIGRRMHTIDDAYIITREVEHIVRIFETREGEVSFAMKSHTFGNREMAVSVKDGRVLAEIKAGNHVYADPMFRFCITHITVSEGYVTMYGEDGNWMRLKVFDTLQQDMDKPVLRGQYVDVNKFLGKIFGGLYRY